MLNTFNLIRRQLVEIGSFGPKISKESVGVFVRASFPRTIPNELEPAKVGGASLEKESPRKVRNPDLVGYSRMRKINFHFSGLRKQFMFSPLSALIVGHRKPHFLGQFFCTARKRLPHFQGCSIFQANQNHGTHIDSR